MPPSKRRIQLTPEQLEEARRQLAEIDAGSLQVRRQLAAKEARDDLLRFVRLMMPDPDDPKDPDKSRYEVAHHHRAIAAALEQVEAGKIPRLILAVPPRHGKLCADSTPVLTSRGWRTHGDLVPGNAVLGPDGHWTKVVGVSLPGEASLRVTFTNGDSVVVHPDHEWTVYDRSKHQTRTIETREMVAGGYFSGPRGKRGGRCRFQLPAVAAVEYADQRLPLDPYVLGVWLGDGATGKGVITMAPEDAAVWRKVENRGFRITAKWVHKDTGVVTVNFNGGKPGVLGPLTSRLHEIGVLREKHIPERYLRSSRDQRLELLAGLMDTDGHVEKRTGRCRIVTTLPALRDGIYDLCLTLGFRPYICEQEAALSSGGVQGRNPVFTVGFQPTVPLPTVLPRRKVDRFAVQRRIGIYLIEECDPEPGRCIEVDRSDGLYLVGRTLLPTHNSQLASKALPAWFLGRNPYQSVIAATYNQDYANDIGRDVRAIVKEPAFREVFPLFKLRQGSAATDRLQAEEGGLAVFVGKGGAITGRGADLAIVDDPIKDWDEASSPTIRDKLWSWYTTVFSTRLMTSQARIILIQTRWHEDDLIGRITDPMNPHYQEQEARKWKIIHLPALAEDNDPLGRERGEPLWPERFDRDFLEAQRVLDSRGFSALYQGRPSPEEGDFFKAEYIKTYKPSQCPENLRYYVASDHAVGIDQTNDQTCILVAGVDEHKRIWLKEAWWRRAPTNTVVEAMIDIIRRYKPLAWFAERGHISKSIGPFLRERMIKEQAFAAIHEQTPVNDKQTRAQSIQGRMALGQVMFPDFLPWFGAAKHELLTFPNATHDDFVDALAHLGLGLSSLVSASPARSAGPAAPKTGTMAWVKEQHRLERRAMNRKKRAGGF